MKILKRWTTTVVASFDRIISQVENHEALITASINEMQEAGARARVQLKRVKRDGDKMRKRLKELNEKAETWKERAVKTAELDKKRALECLRRKKRAEEDINSLEEQERSHYNIQKQLSQDLEQIEERLAKLKQQRNILRTRQSRAEALQVIQAEDNYLISEIDDIFDRWETKVEEYELRADLKTCSDDDFEAEFEDEEDTAELEADLDELLAAEAS